MSQGSGVSAQRLRDSALALAASGELAQAEAAYRRIVQSDPEDHAAWHALGLIALEAGQLPLAVQCIEAATAINDKVALYQRNLCEMYRRLSQLEKAEQAGRRATKLAPADLDAHYNLGLVYSDAKDSERAIACYRQALKLGPRHKLSWNNLGSALEQRGDKTAALAAYETAIAVDPRHAEAQNNAGAIYSEQGRLDEARAALLAAIAARPHFVEAHYNLCALKKYTRDDPHLAMLEAVHARREALPEQARIRYCFALGKALDDIGEFDRAFAAYEEGNRLQHALLPVDEARADALLQAIMAVFDERFFAERRAWRRAEDPKRTPIFIVGMPRSGTTLLEQILSSHASVHGAGELADLNELVSGATGASARTAFHERATLLSEADVRRLGGAYLERVWKRSPQSRFITDKMPANFFYLGLIHLALPHARVIHAMRDPMDSCFSCYARLFNETMDFAYDQGTLGRYYVRYFTLMRHWHKVLPPGSILDLSYEDMVADTESQARRVLQFVGLPWDPACLEFYKNERPVRTASLAQVREPIYKSSVARWKHFARHLRPLYEIVKDTRPGGEALAGEPTAAPAPLAADAPQQAQARYCEGVAHHHAGRLGPALAAYDEALALFADFPAALNNRGFVLQDLDRMDEALASFARAVELAPAMAMARLNLGMAQLKLGDWERGWENFEARWTGSAEAASATLERPACPLPQWHGQEDTADKRLLVLTEQGYGDTIQFSRYLSLAAKRFARVGFTCSPPMLRLMEWSLGGEVVTFTRMPSDFASWDLQCPLMSLPRAFGTRPDTVPATTPTLRVPGPAAAHWRERLERAAPGGLRVGIAWAGRRTHQFDARRSLLFAQLAPLLADERVSWVSLQKRGPGEAPPAVAPSLAWIDWTDELGDFADTAALVQCLDLVICVDSAVAHLAGALDRPVWLMNRFDGEWRWLRHREDSPWYPSLRIFRQPAFGDWPSLIERLRQELAALPLPRGARRPGAARRASPGAKETAAAEGLPQAQRLHEQGILAWRSGRPQEALRLIHQAISLDGHEALFHSNLAEMNRLQGRLDEAIRQGEQAVALGPALATAHSNLGIAYYDAKDYDRAEQCHRRALALAPRLVQSLNNLGSIARARKDRKAAADWYGQALAIDADYLESLSNLGAVLVEDDRPDAAEPWLARALQLQPAYPEALCNLGLVRIKQERMEEAMGLLRRSLQLRPRYPEAQVGLARALQEDQQLAQALQLLQQATHEAPGSADAWCQLGSACAESGEPAQAEAAYGHALKIDPGMADALVGLGNLRLEEGRIEDSVGLLEQALRVDPDNVGARFHLALARKVGLGDANLAALQAKLARSSELSANRRIGLHYALGKAYDDLEQWDEAFPHFLEGARLKRASLRYDADLDAARARRIADIVERRFIERLRGAGEPSDRPVFVLGMPRSGTTLTEQILASHPEVFGAGELRDLLEVVQQPTRPGAPAGFPDNLAGLTREAVTAWGAQYVARIRQRAPAARRITDKMPGNYLALGLITLMLPQARIIHVRRNPLDTCVSAFTRLFNRHQDATYDLYELGHHYASYARLMDHWRAVLPPGSFLEVAYEDIVANVEEQARRLVDWLGLEWNDACLDFHKARREVRTASLTQVRQPIYRSSVEKWRKYEKFLGPLMDGLGEYART